MCTHIEGGLELKDVVIQAMFVMEKIRENNQKSKNLIELYAKHSLGLKHDKI